MDTDCADSLIANVTTVKWVNPLHIPETKLSDLWLTLMCPPKARIGDSSS